MKSYSKPLDVDGVNTPCTFLAMIEMYVLRDMTSVVILKKLET